MCKLFLTFFYLFTIFCYFYGHNHYKMKHWIASIVMFFSLLYSCSPEKQPNPYTFYYWKTTLKLNPKEKNTLKQATEPFLYTRFFDIDLIKGKPQPVGVIQKENSFETDKTIVPVVFITNRTFINIKEDDLRILSQNVWNLIQKKQRELHLGTSPEIQIDCDWTAGTQQDFFLFLKILKHISGKEITSTLRLHQVKDKEKMGIPPVSKVYLMCYSTSSPLEKSDKNSILEVDVLKSYLAKIHQYPIKNIAIALPIYSWGIVTNQNGKHKLINALSSEDLEHPHLKKTSINEAVITKDGFYFGHYLNRGFKIKIEEIKPSEILKVTDFLDSKLDGYPIVYYQLDSKFLKSHFERKN